MKQNTAGIPARSEGCAGENQSSAQFTEWLQGYRTPVVQFVYRMVQDRGVAEDLAMEALLRFRRATSSGSSAPDAIRLFRIATELALREAANAGHSIPAGRSLDLPDVRRAMASIPGKQRAAVLMHKYHGLDCRQIASVLNCPESAARALLLSGYGKLRQSLATRMAPMREGSTLPIICGEASAP